MNIKIQTLQNSEIAAVLPQLFKILYNNMNPIAPLNETYEDASENWCRIIGAALEDPRRTMLIVRDGKEIIGFFMYACNRESGLFLMEEIQLIPSRQGTGIFRRIYDEVLPSLPAEIVTVEAYAHKNNLRSQGILEHLGLCVIGENKTGNCRHYRAPFSEFVRHMKGDA